MAALPLFLFVAGLVNIGLGFALAVYLGRRYRVPAALTGPRSCPSSRPSTPTAAPSGSAPETAEAIGVVGVAEPATAVAETPLAEPEAAFAAAAAAAAERPAGEADSPPSPGEASVVEFQAEVHRYHERLTDADDALRSHIGMADAAAIEAVLSSLMAATDEYLQRRQQCHEQFESLHQAEAELTGVRRQLQQSLDRQDEQVRDSRQQLRTIDAATDPEAGCREACDQTGKLLDANHQVRDALEGVKARMARRGQHGATTPPDRRLDPMTGLPGRAGVEAALERWWTEDSQRVRGLSMAVVDIDRFAEINEQYGCKVGDRMIRAVGQLLQAERRSRVTAGRLAGARFVVLCPDTDVLVTASLAEHLRQTVEATRFLCRGGEIRVTVSCAVTEAAAEDSSESLLVRAEAALHEAKRYGRNRTFLHDGKYPAPVVPPNFALEEKQIPL